LHKLVPLKRAMLYREQDSCQTAVLVAIIL
jgi:hypothetical protein